MRNLRDRTNKPVSGIAKGLLLLVALVLMAVACGEPSGDETIVASDASSSATDGSEQSPLLGLMGVSFDSEETTADQFNELYKQSENLIAECMVAQGFEYKPFDHSQLESGDGYHLSREYAQDYGFGVASLDDPFRFNEPLPGQITNDPNKEIVYPNDAYVESLSPNEADAYRVAFQGTGEGDEGCQGHAFTEVFALFFVIEDFGYSDEDIQAAVEADPRVLEAASQWQTCMAEAGYGFADKAEAKSAFVDKFEAIVANYSDSFDGPIPPAAERELEQLAVKEREAAVASWDCELPRRDMELVVEREYEQRFVAEHGSAVQAALGERS